MLVNTSTSLLFFIPLATQTLGLAVPRTEPSESPSSNLRDLAEEYVAELTLQNTAIEDIENQLAFGDEASAKTIIRVTDELMESYYRQMEPRNRMVEIAPTDSVLDLNSIEYLVAVAARYSDNVMHFAREIRKNPTVGENPMLALKQLKKEHKKIMMFDQILLGLANVAMTDSSFENSDLSQIEEPSAQNDSVNTADVTLTEAQKLEEPAQREVSVVVEEEIQTTTTETIVTSYTETTVTW